MALFALESGEFFFQIDLPDFQHGVSMGPSKLRQMVRALLSAGASARLLPIFPMAQRGQRWNVSSAELALSMPFSNFGIGILPAELSKFMLRVTFQRAYLEQMMTVLLHGRPGQLNPWHFRLTGGNPNFHI